MITFRLRILRTNSDFCLIQHEQFGFYNRAEVFTARYGLSPYTTQTRFFSKGLIHCNEQTKQSANGIYSWHPVPENGYIHCISDLLLTASLLWNAVITKATWWRVKELENLITEFQLLLSTDNKLNIICRSNFVIDISWVLHAAG